MFTDDSVQVVAHSYTGRKRPSRTCETGGYTADWRFPQGDIWPAWAVTPAGCAFLVNLIAKADRNLVVRLPYGGLDDRAITRPVERR